MKLIDKLILFFTALWFFGLCYWISAQDTSEVYFKSILHTDSSYSDLTYKLININNDTIIVDEVAISSEAEFRIGIGEQQLLQYPIYYFILFGEKEYVTGASLIPYKSFDYLRNEPRITVND